MNFTEFLKSGHVILWDGGMGTTIASRWNDKCQNPNAKCNEELNLITPEIIQAVHEDFIRAGSQVIETNTFGANRIALAEHGLENKVREINLAAVRIARKVARGGFISASIGPTSKLPTLGHISFDEMVSAYREQASVLIEAGVDILQIETCQDILQAKAAVIASVEVLKCRSVEVPIIVTVTLERSGTTLLGTEVGAALAALAPLGISAFGLNCGTGPEEMEDAIALLSENSPIPIIIQPNAGLPEIKDGVAHYNLGPKEFAEWTAYFAEKFGVRLIGGCCGTTAEHIKTVNKHVTAPVRRPFGGSEPKKQSQNPPSPPFTKGGNGDRTTHDNMLSSLYSPISLDQSPPPLIVGERMNINGSKEFREHILADNFDAAAGMAKRQTERGAHILDLSVAYAGRDEIKDMHEMSRRLATLSPLPIMIDSTNPEVIETGLTHLGGRSVINSINLEDGGKKAEKIVEIAKRHGSALVALTIDEEGMAMTAKKKIAVAERIIKLCPDLTLFIDLLTFTLADPKAAEAGSGRETLKAIELLKHRTILGVSNISYGFKPEARKILNSIFLYEAVKAGLDAAIVHAGQILPLHKIDKEAARLALELIYCKGANALQRFTQYFERVIPAKAGIQRISRDSRFHGNDHESILANHIIDGNKEGLEDAVGEALKELKAEEIINSILLPAMQTVGERFGNNELPLPFVLQSAEVMRVAVDIVKPHLKVGDAASRGTIVLATVRGDVHDIGKNLVDIILSNNGYRVINLGVKQPAHEIIEAALKYKTDAIGLSGLIVQSCMVMKDDLAEMAHRKIKIPVICGGAALTKKFVENDLQKAYEGRVYYARDAFDGLKIMNNECQMAKLKCQTKIK